MESVLLKKGPDIVKVKSKSWKKVWCKLRISKDMSVQLVIYKLSSKTNEKVYDESEKLCVPNKSANHVLLVDKTNEDLFSLASGPNVSGNKNNYKISQHEAEIIPVIHAFAKLVQEADNGDHVFSLHLSDGTTWLFNASNAPARNLWMSEINCNAGKKSKPAMRGGLSSNNYGWSLSRNTADVSNSTPISSGISKVVAWSIPPTPIRLISSLAEVSI
jgi:hypothetical protein